MTEEALLLAGQDAAEHGLKLHALGIHDHGALSKAPCKARCLGLIDNMIRTKFGLGWHWKGPYSGDNAFAWCGAFAASCWAIAGLGFQIRHRHLASTYRLDRWGRGPRLKSIPECRAGDIIVIGHKEPYGDHICIATGPATKEAIPTVEGNATGQGIGGRYEGVVTNMRPLQSVVRVYRPLPEDLGPVVEQD